jgi:hypothetical protein
MIEFLQSSAALWVYRIAALAAVVAVGFYVVARVRAGLRASGPTTSDLITDFRDLHRRGELSDEEYKTIKGTLSSRLQQELKEDKNEG